MNPWTVSATWEEWEGPHAEDHPAYAPDDDGRHAAGYVFGASREAGTRHQAEEYRKAFRRQYGHLPGFAVDLAGPGGPPLARQFGLDGVRRARAVLGELPDFATSGRGRRGHWHGGPSPCPVCGGLSPAAVYPAPPTTPQPEESYA